MALQGWLKWAGIYAEKHGMNQPDELKTSEQWAAIYKERHGIQILDPDGWDRSDGFMDSWMEPIGRKTFDERLLESTITITP
jgi:hypothetical protein